MMKNKGITLIALVITIIILLILAGITINAITKENGLFSRAREAKEKTIEKQEEENKIIDSYISILDENGTVIPSKDNQSNGATMMLISFSNITGESFVINVNNAEVNKDATLYYYVNNSLVYSGKDRSFKVTNVNGNSIEENQEYEVKVLSDPYSIKVVTKSGDSIKSWLACIGNPNTENYTADEIDKIFENKQLVLNLLSNDSANEYLLNSTDIILPKFNSKCDEICADSEIFTAMCKSEKIMSYIYENSDWRNAMYDNYNITEEAIAKSSIAINAMKSSSRFALIKNSIGNSTYQLYQDKCFVIGYSQGNILSNKDVELGQLLSGNLAIKWNEPANVGNDGMKHILGKFASQLSITQRNGDWMVLYIAILKI